jgi:hypothetical protein
MPDVVESDTRDCGAANEVAERCSEVLRDDRRTVRASRVTEDAIWYQSVGLVPVRSG